MFKILDIFLMLLSCCFGIESAQVPAFFGFGVDLARINAVLAGFEFTDHGSCFGSGYKHRARFRSPSMGVRVAVCFDLPITKRG